MLIIPAIYPEVFEEVVDKLYVLTDIPDISKFAQIVICDGSYGLPISWSPLGKEILPETFQYELDLILTDWKPYIPKAYKLGIRRVIVHIDEFTEADYQDLFSLVGSHGIVLGLTVSNDVSIDVLVNALKRFESPEYFGSLERVFVQVSGMRTLAEDNHPFDERAVARIRILKKMFPSLVVQAGGRINPETAWLIKDAGADRMVVGSYLFGHSDVEEAIRLLKEAMEQEKLSSVKKEEVQEKVVEKREEKKHVADELRDGRDEVVPRRKETKAEREKREAYEASKDEIVYNVDGDIFADEV